MIDILSFLLGKKMTGSNVEIESLSVTENGTYTAPTGKAYSPVTVNVVGGPAFGLASVEVAPSIITVTVNAEEVT